MEKKTQRKYQRRPKPAELVEIQSFLASLKKFHGNRPFSYMDPGWMLENLLKEIAGVPENDFSLRAIDFATIQRTMTNWQHFPHHKDGPFPQGKMIALLLFELEYLYANSY